ncbi:hypothetical protein BO70DRAFT_361487 [Aspergillus heteromorphus CBS 117.55]|uniref:T6SS Phospholipase effector Tle1-like catalytic domain-containing protein n=1 Tax=Aspergillus heteromorphus CBS 117.55 TaxID=1448321 RepID=A0A317WDS3_9EURO|nr:uncharacterized protein BO70DRAFT_361487 [Aspergillus heteromorphus CBS 117.55]PWY83372.1 hypothetical protein BO70DRAFT_361487 [Aspergillus heteromorphus CBS 117.55]
MTVDPKNFNASRADAGAKLDERPPRRLIVCCDGSWQSSNHGTKNIASNVAKLSRSIANYGKNKEGDLIQQIVFYDAGVGTSNSSEGGFVDSIHKRWEGGTGQGLEENVCEGYNFIVNNWLPGDEIYIFGFSRGAYTARALAGMICNMGICFPDMMDDWWAVYELYKNRKKKEAEEKAKEAERKKKKPTNELKAQVHSMVTSGGFALPGMEFMDRFQKNVHIEVVGVFDTVAALGLPNNTTIDVKKRNEAYYGFHDADVHPQIKYAFHALALDEYRKAFEPTMWHLPDDNKNTELYQCWFPGYHINVGGGSENTQNHYGDLEAMANLSLAWMIDQVRHNTPLAFEDYALVRLYQNYMCTILDLSRRSFSKGDSWCRYSYGESATQAASGVADPDNLTAYGGCGLGYRPDSMTWKMRASGCHVRTPGQYEPDNLDERGSKKPRSRTHEYIHPVVAYAMSKAYVDAHGETVLKYEPSALAGFKRVKNPIDPYDSRPIPEGIYWAKEVDAGHTEQTYVKQGLEYAKSFIWTPPKPVKKMIYIEEMPLFPDAIDNPTNERDYMRADWLAMWAPRHGFAADVNKDIANYLDKTPKTYVFTDRELYLLELLLHASKRVNGSIWKEKSLVYALRARPSPGYETEKSERMQATGERTRQFLQDLDEKKI